MNGSINSCILLGILLLTSAWGVRELREPEIKISPDERRQENSRTYLKKLIKPTWRTSGRLCKRKGYWWVIDRSGKEICVIP